MHGISFVCSNGPVRGDDALVIPRIDIQNIVQVVIQIVGFGYFAFEIYFYFIFFHFELQSLLRN
jgi:hypothetical protein